MKKHLSVSIGIPAYNEEANIESLLTSILAQREENFTIKEIFILSDGSSDSTVKKVKKVKDKRIKLIHDTKRMGKSYRVNQILRKFSTEVLFLIDADVSINDVHMLTKIIRKSVFEIDGVVGVNTMPIHAKTYFEKIVESGVFVMKNIVKNWEGGRNYLAFRGSLLALDGKLAKQMVLKQSLVNNDAYIYFYALENGYAPRYLSDITVWYRSPLTFSDHLKQATRYQSSLNEMKKYFSLDLQKAYTIPKRTVFASTAKYAILKPQYLFPYLVVNFITRLRRSGKVKSTWSIATSTKVAIF